MLDKMNHRIPVLLLTPKYRFVRHFFIQFVVLLITVNILWDVPEQVLSGRLAAWFTYFLQINIVIYANMYILVPRLLLKGRTLYYIISFLLLTLFSIFIIGMLQMMYSLDSSDNSSTILSSISSLVAFMTFITGLTTIQLFKYHLANVRRISELQNATMEIELANLQSQINPHFLFNMLNNANIMAWEDVDKSSYMLLKLKDLLRYQVDEGLKESIKLNDDIAFIRDYLELEKMRRDRFCYTIHSEGNINVEIPPLLFIPFIENAVKHNPENDSYIEIYFRVTSDKLYFECKNPKARLSQATKVGGIGLVNVKKRLLLLFEGNYGLWLKDESETYTVKMEFSL